MVFVQISKKKKALIPEIKASSTTSELSNVSLLLLCLEEQSPTVLWLVRYPPIAPAFRLAGYFAVKGTLAGHTGLEPVIFRQLTDMRIPQQAYSPIRYDRFSALPCFKYQRKTQIDMWLLKRCVLLPLTAERRVNTVGTNQRSPTRDSQQNVFCFAPMPYITEHFCSFHCIYYTIFIHTNQDIFSTNIRYYYVRFLDTITRDKFVQKSSCIFARAFKRSLL